jgi:hypothetical protein
MSASGSNRILLPALVLGCGLVLADESEAPEAAFIEYLGMWEESDEEWMMFEADDTRATVEIEAQRSDPVPRGEESKEQDDEG